jgi:hypothetical protein
MRRLLYRTWIAKKPDALEFGHTLVYHTDGESSLYPKKSIGRLTKYPMDLTADCVKYVSLRGHKWLDSGNGMASGKSLVNNSRTKTDPQGL